MTARNNATHSSQPSPLMAAASFPQPDPSSPNNPNAQYGDILLVHIGGSLGHAAIYIDAGLWFEKTDPDPSFAYRLNTDMSAAEFASTDIIYKYIRVLEPQKLPDPSTIFTTSVYSCAQTKLTATNALLTRPISISYNDAGQANLAPATNTQLIGSWPTVFYTSDPTLNPYAELCAGNRGPELTT